MTDLEFQIAIDPDRAQEIAEDEKKQERLWRCAHSFTEFLGEWRFIDQETGRQRVLGEAIWEGQEQILEAMEYCPKFFNLKARKLGVTTIECAFDGWRTRFGPPNGRVHLFSRREDAAKELLEQVHYGLSRMPSWMQLPAKGTAYQVVYTAGPDDRRILKSYPASEETAVEASCVHGHVDEWARMKNPEAVWQAIEPSMAGTCHLITTGRGPENFAGRFWRRCEEGETDFVPIFVSALNRPDRDRKWFETKVKGMTEQARKQEFPLTAEEALFAGGSVVFDGRSVGIAGGGVGPQAAQDGHRYLKSWDIGRHKDASVGIVLDTSIDPIEVVEYIRLRKVPYPQTQATIERVHGRYPGVTVVEKNNAGEAVFENLRIPERERELFQTGGHNKPKIIEGLQLALEQHSIRWSAADWPQLHSEIENYQIPDKGIVQDSVMALAIGVWEVGQGAGVRKCSVGKIEMWA